MVRRVYAAAFLRVYVANGRVSAATMTVHADIPESEMSLRLKYVTIAESGILCLSNITGVRKILRHN